MAASRKVVLVVGSVKFAKERYEQAKALTETFTFVEFSGTKESLIHQMYEAKFENVSAIFHASDGSNIIDKYDTELIEALSNNVDVLLVFGNARELVNVEAATKEAIHVIDTSETISLGNEKAEETLFDDLESTLLRGVPIRAVNDPEKVAENAKRKAMEIIKAAGTLDELDLKDAVQFFQET